MTLDRNLAEAACMLTRLVSTPSPTGQEGKIAHLIADMMRGLAFDSVEVDSSHNVMGVVRGSKPGKALLMLTHSDTGAKSLTGSLPVGAVAEGKQFGKRGWCLVGPGAAAPKAAITAFLLAGADLAKHKDRFVGEARVAVVTKDLMANHDGPREVQDRLKDVAFAISAEPTSNDIVTAARGILHLEVTINGYPGHWGAPQPSNNALYRLAGLLTMLRDEPLGHDPRFGTTGFNPVYAEVVADPPHSPSEIRLTVDRRLLPGECAASFVGRVSELLAELKERNPGFEGEVRIARQMHPYEAREGLVELDMLMRISERALGRKPKSQTVTFGTNAAFLSAELNIPCLILGPGSIADLGPQEHVELREVATAGVIYREFAYEFLAP